MRDSEKLYMQEKLREEREQSDKAYAIKLVEKIVFGLVGLIIVAVFSAIIGLVILP